jgi:hypothetical protein
MSGSIIRLVQFYKNKKNLISKSHINKETGRLIKTLNWRKLGLNRIIVKQIKDNSKK